MIQTKAPWLNNYGDVPHSLEYPTGSMWDEVEKIALKYPNNIAFDFMGKKITVGLCGDLWFDENIVLW